MRMNKYMITGEAFNGDDELVDVSELIEAEDTRDAYEKFISETEYQFFGGVLKTCDAETGGEKGATYKDSEGRYLEIDIID